IDGEYKLRIDPASTSNGPQRSALFLKPTPHPSSVGLVSEAASPTMKPCQKERDCPRGYSPGSPRLTKLPRTYPLLPTPNPKPPLSPHTATSLMLGNLQDPSQTPTLPWSFALKTLGKGKLETLLFQSHHPGIGLNDQPPVARRSDSGPSVAKNYVFSIVDSINSPMEGVWSPPSQEQ
ncbi:hypothetical protein TorRG33x02_059310, partial [Trema orientale]